MDAEFDKWCEKLLDTGKGNRLINFKQIGLKTVDVLAPIPLLLFDKISKGDTLTFFDVDEYIKYIKPTRNDKGEILQISKEQVSKEIAIYMKKSEILAYKSEVSLSKLLKNLKSVATFSLNEKGINTLYLAFGFLHWKDDKNNNLSSPLVLIPVTIKYDAATSTYSLSQYEEEFNTNPTLVYKLKMEYDISLPEFREQYFENETLGDYFNRLRSTFEKKHWTVSDNMVIGTFSFLKLNMYKDLKENEEAILSNTLIKKLLSRESQAEPEPEIDVDSLFKNNYETTDIHSVVDADSSQLAAIINAKAGKSFVLQGPPGTGKSQTITNIIAELIYSGKKVLFVSEKLAALNVVYNNLKKAKLANFCLELHSNKTNKKEVVSELYRVLNSNKMQVTFDAQSETEELLAVKSRLDEYSNFMYTKLSTINLTPYEILNKISSYDSLQSIDYAFADIGSKGSEFISLALHELEAFTKYEDILGYDYRSHAWHGYINPDLTYQTKLKTKKQLTTCTEYLSELILDLSKLNKKLCISLSSLDDLKSKLNYINFLPKINLFSPILLNKEALSTAYEALQKYNADTLEYNTLSQEVAEVYEDEIYENPLNEFYLRFRNDYSSPLRFFSGRFRRDNRTLKHYQKNINQKLNYNKTLGLLKSAKTVQSLKTSLLTDEVNLLNMLELPKLNTKKYDFKEIENIFANLLSLLPSELTNYQNLTEKQFNVMQQAAKEFVEKFSKTNSKLQTLESLQQSFNVSVCNFNTLSIDALNKKLKACLVKFDDFDNWVRFNAIISNIDNLQLKEFVDKFLDNHLPQKSLTGTFELMIYTQWMYLIIDEYPVLYNFNRQSQDMAVEVFKKKDKLKFEISKAEIIAKLTSELPNLNNMAPGSQVSTLVREANKKSRLKPVRMLLNEIDDLVFKLKPCFLMSPLSVSTYLDPKSYKFDVVIFDEASQIFPWDAIGSIYRGKQVIVVGDSKQMPPSNFFNAGVFADDYDSNNYEDDSLDFESILDLCSSVFSQIRLNWHYRSKTEDLINFSNKNFYDGNLVTFPSSTKNCKGMGIDHYFVPNGIFDRKTNTNYLEAKKVVDLIFEHFDKYPNRSLGVVAFSISQQEAIDSLLEKQLQAKPNYVKFFDENRPEPFFIKNLETVQGDERDTIIFSVAYAKDAEGKFYHNFGPLNQKGGERRLNVAITRAKYNVKLVTSINSSDINLKKTESTGARMLKEYLAYAEQGNTDISWKTVETNKTQTLEKQVYKTLIDAGFKAQMNIGSSKFTIDIGVKHPKKPNYVMAVECDGDTYHLGKTTRDRNRTRGEVLERLGWKYYRIWSADWFVNKATEKKRLIAAVNKAIADFDASENSIENNTTNGAAKSDAETKKVTESFMVKKQVESTDLKALFKTYQPYDIYQSGTPSFKKCIYKMVKQEQPVHEEQLMKEVAEIYGKNKITGTVRAQFYADMQSVADTVTKKYDYYYTDPESQVEMRLPAYGTSPRNINYISIDELASGMLVIIKNNIGITKDGLFATMSKLLGYSRQTESITGRLNQTLNFLVAVKQVKKDNDELFLG